MDESVKEGKNTFIKAKFLLQIHDVLRGHQQHGNVRDHDGGAGGRPAGLRLHLLQVHPHWAATVHQAVSQEVRVRPANIYTYSDTYIRTRIFELL